MASTGERKDPFKGFKFRIEVGGITRAGFREASVAQHPIGSLEDPAKLAALKLPSLKGSSPSGGASPMTLSCGHGERRLWREPWNARTVPSCWSTTPVKRRSVGTS